MILSPLPVQKFFGNDARPLNGGQLFTYAAGTTTKIGTAKDAAGTANTNPIQLDYRGEANVWLDPTLTYKFVLSPANDTDPPTNPIWTVDNISALGGLTAEIIGQIIWPRSASEIAAAVTPVTYRYKWGDGRRYGMTDDGITDCTTFFQNALNGCAGFVPVELPRVVGSFYKMTGQVTAPSNTEIFLLDGATVQWTATVANGPTFLGSATRLGILSSGGNFRIHGNGSIVGPSVATYVLNETAIFCKGTSTSSRLSNIQIEEQVQFYNWGSYGVLCQYVNNIYVGASVRLHDIGYAGALFASCNSIRFSADIDTITPGTGGNAYGVTFTHDSTTFNIDPTVNPFCRDVYCDAVVSNVPLWAGLDSHGGFNIVFNGAKVYNCRFPLAIASGSGDAANYAGANNSIIGCVATTLKRDGSATTIASAPIGIGVNGGSVDQQRGVRVIGNVLDGYGDQATASPNISATRCIDGVIEGNTFRNWQGLGIGADSSFNMNINNNTFGAVSTATLSKCIKVSGTGSYSFIGNKHVPGSGTAALEGVRVDDTNTPRILAINDFNSCTSQRYANDTGGFLDGTRFRDNSDIEPRIDVTGAPVTLDASAAGLAKRIWFNLNVTGPSTVTDISNSFIGQEILLYSPTANVTTFNRANAALPGGANYVSTQFDVLELKTVATAGVKFVAIAPSAANS